MKNSNPKLNTKYRNVANNASKNNLKIAISDAKRMALEAQTKHTYLLESINLNEKTTTSLEKLHSEFSKQFHKNYTQKLEHLKLKNDIPVHVPYQNEPKKYSKSRRFIPRRKYRKWKKVESAKKNLDLIHNFSDINLSNDMISLLNKGPGFVPVEKNPKHHSNPSRPK